MATDKLTPLSQQQLVDCYGRCNCGTNAEVSLRYIHDIGGIASSSDYPYLKKVNSLSLSFSLSLSPNVVVIVLLIFLWFLDFFPDGVRSFKVLQSHSNVWTR